MGQPYLTPHSFLFLAIDFADQVAGCSSDTVEVINKFDSSAHATKGSNGRAARAQNPRKPICRRGVQESCFPWAREQAIAGFEGLQRLMTWISDRCEPVTAHPNAHHRSSSSPLAATVLEVMGLELSMLQHHVEIAIGSSPGTAVQAIAGPVRRRVPPAHRCRDRPTAPYFECRRRCGALLSWHDVQEEHIGQLHPPAVGQGWQGAASLATQGGRCRFAPAAGAPPAAGWLALLQHLLMALSSPSFPSPLLPTPTAGLPLPGRGAAGRPDPRKGRPGAHKAQQPHAGLRP